MKIQTMSSRFGINVLPLIVSVFIFAGCQIPYVPSAQASTPDSSTPTPANIGNGQGNGALAGGTAGTTNEASNSMPVRVITPPRLKKVVAVSRFENRTGVSGGGQYALDEGMADQLSDALVQSKCFTVVERETLGDVEDEKKIKKAGMMAKSNSAQSGKLVSAQILIKGTITEFEANSGGSGKKIKIPIPGGFFGSGGGFNLGDNRSEAHVGLIIRLIDTTTGEVLDSQRVEGKATSGTFGGGYESSGVSFQSDSFKTTPLGKATQLAIDDAVFKIASRLKDVPFQGRVIKINGEDELLIRGGTSAGMSVGDTFILYSVGESLVDPDTGDQLGTELAKKGSIKVTHIEEKYAKAKSEAPLAGIKVGDMVKAQ
ncbi:MAG: CsgG/HfaB family protein [bacterium]